MTCPRHVTLLIRYSGRFENDVQTKFLGNVSSPHIQIEKFNMRNRLPIFYHVSTPLWFVYLGLSCHLKIKCSYYIYNVPNGTYYIIYL